RIGCKTCSDELKVYAGIEKSTSLEAEGYKWSQSIAEDEFICSCGNTKFSLVPIRTGLHGLLQRNLNPKTDKAISSIRLYEKTALEESCRGFLKLIDSKVAEEELQKFLESHPLFFHVFLPKKLIFKPPVLTKYFADFGVLNERKELLLIEIERPTLRLS